MPKIEVEAKVYVRGCSALNRTCYIIYAHATNGSEMFRENVSRLCTCKILPLLHNVENIENTCVHTLYGDYIFIADRRAADDSRFSCGGRTINQFAVQSNAQ